MAKRINFQLDYCIRMNYSQFKGGLRDFVTKNLTFRNPTFDGAVYQAGNYNARLYIPEHIYGFNQINNDVMEIRRKNIIIFLCY